jgi:hypothetical protein
MVESKVKIVCTDRGQHPRAALDNLMVTTGADQTKEQDLATGLRARCPRCLRNPVWRREKAAAILAGAVEAGMATLDISYLERNHG